MTDTKKKQPTSKGKTQVVGFRLPYDVYEQYERLCCELQIEMGTVARDAVQQFLATSDKFKKTGEILSLACSGKR